MPKLLPINPARPEAGLVHAGILGSHIAVIEPFTYKPILSSRERRAYAAAHRIAQKDFMSGVKLATPGAIRSLIVDEIAKIIMEES